MNMTAEKFDLKVITEQGRKKVFFANNTDDFVEVILEIDGREARLGELVGSDVRGYCFPPHYERAIVNLKDGRELPFRESGQVKATVYAGQAMRKEDELDLPAFIWRKLPKKKVRFSRDGNEPIGCLEVGYGEV